MVLVVLQAKMAKSLLTTMK